MRTKILNHASKGPKNIDNIPIVEISPREGVDGLNQYTITSVDFGDKTTWYQSANKVTEEELLPDGSTYTTYTSENLYWINVDSYKLTSQEYNINGILKGLWMADGTGLQSKSEFRPLIYKNGYIVEDGYTIDYENGSVVFTTPNNEEDLIEATYYYAVDSSFIIRPPEGRKWIISYNELNFSKSIQLNDDFLAEIWAGDPNYQYLYDPYCQYRMTYRSIQDFMNISVCGADEISAFGGTETVEACASNGWTQQKRGLTDNVMIIPFNYDRCQSIILNSNVYAAMRFKIKNDIPVTNTEVCTVTTYLLCKSNS